MIAAGFGFSTKATADSLQDAYTKAVQGQNVTHLVVPIDKSDAKVFVDFVDRVDLPVIGLNAETIFGTETLTHSERSQVERGVGSVAEAAALVASGGHLLAPRSISDDRMATCAIAIGDRE